MAKEYICVIGSLNYDIIIKQKRLPQMGETYTADSITYSGGGKGANQAVQCAKLGYPTVMVGKVGEDSFGDKLLKNLNEYGVDCTCVKRSSLDTGVGIVHALEDGAVYATIITGANFDMKKQEIDELEELIKNSKVLVLQLEIPVEIVEYILDQAKAWGVYTILNAAPAKEISREALRKVSCLIVNETEASFYAGAEITDLAGVEANREKLEALCPGTIIVTLGAKGSVLLEQGNVTPVESVKAEYVAETTGAGDSYIGAFAYGMCKGMESGEACRFASRVSSLTVQKIGAQEGMPYFNEL